MTSQTFLHLLFLLQALHLFHQLAHVARHLAFSRLLLARNLLAFLAHLSRRALLLAQVTLAIAHFRFHTLHIRHKNESLDSDITAGATYAQTSA